MANYTLIHVDLSDPNSYNPPNNGTLPGAVDTVIGMGVGGRDGTLNVNRLENLWITANATVTANSADTITVGNLNAAGGAVDMTIDGIVTTQATIYANGKLTADTVNGALDINGGQVDLSAGLSVTSVFGLFMTGGHLTVDGTLAVAAAASIFATQSAIIDIDALSLGAGSAEVDLQA